MKKWMLSLLLGWMLLNFCACRESNVPASNIDAITASITTTKSTDSDLEIYILNTNSRKIHHPNCRSVKLIKEENQKIYQGSIDDILLDGYSTCGHCLKR